MEGPGLMAEVSAGLPGVGTTRVKSGKLGRNLGDRDPPSRKTADFPLRAVRELPQHG